MNVSCILLITDSRLQKSLKLYADSVPAAKAWRDVGKGLGLTAEDLHEIGDAAVEKSTVTSKQVEVDHEQVRSEARRMLEKWVETSGENARAEQLLSVVKKLKLNDVAGRPINNMQFCNCINDAATVNLYSRGGGER